MSVTGMHAALAALTDAGIRYATTPGDVTTPCCYVYLHGESNEDVVVAGGTKTVLGVAWIPIRGMADLVTNQADVAAVVAALEPVVIAPLNLALSSVVVGEVSWPAWTGTAEVL